MAQLVKHHLIHYEEEIEAASTQLFHEQELEALKKQTFDQGYLEGTKAERARIEKNTEDTQQRLSDLIKSIPQAIEQNRLALNKEVAQLSLFIIQHYFVNQSINPKILEEQINQLIAQLNEQQQIEVHLHPKDIQALQQGKIQINNSKLLKIKSAEHLHLGGFLIKTEQGIFEANIEKQIDRLKDYLLGIQQGET